MTSDPLTIVGAVALGALGSLLRAEVVWWSERRTSSARLGVWLVNLGGALLLGVVVGCVEGGLVGEGVAFSLGAGLLGGLTTFSTWMVAVVRPDGAASDGRVARDILVHGVGMLLAGVLMAATGVVIGSALV